MNLRIPCTLEFSLPSRLYSINKVVGLVNLMKFSLFIIPANLVGNVMVLLKKISKLISKFESYWNGFPGLLNYIKTNLICTNHIKTQWLSLKLAEPVAEHFFRSSNIESVTYLFLLFYEHYIVWYCTLWLNCNIKPS